MMSYYLYGLGISSFTAGLVKENLGLLVLGVVFLVFGSLLIYGEKRK